MKINAKVTILFSQPNDRSDSGPGGLTIEIMDNDSRKRFVKLHMNAEQTIAALSRVSNVPVEMCEVDGLDVVGMTKEAKDFSFILPPLNGKSSKEVAAKEAAAACPEGWTPSLYFGSQNSFFTKDGDKYARTTIYRFVPRDDSQPAQDNPENSSQPLDA